MTNDIAGVVIELLNTDGADIEGLFSSVAVKQRTMISASERTETVGRRISDISKETQINFTYACQGSTTDHTLGFSSCMRPQTGIASCCGQLQQR